ncbi:MAG: glycosyltransferase family 39 protein [Bacteroidota bacterium]
MDIIQLPRSKYIWVGFTVILCVALFSNLGLLSLQFEEPRRAIVALEMEISGNYINPKINGFDYYNKAPFYNWLLILFFKAFGSSDEWVVRLPTVFSFLAIALINYRIVRQQVNKQIAIHSSLIFLTASNLLYYFSFQGEIDMFYSLIVYLQIICLLYYFQHENYLKLFLISYALTGIGVITKGIPSLAFQAITILAIFIYYKRFKALFSIWNFVGIFVMCGIIGGYFYLYSLEDDPLPMITRLITESSKRSALEESWYKSLVQLYKFPLLVFTMFLPWSLLPFSTKLKLAWKTAISNQWVRFSLIFVISNSVVYWLSPGTKDRYLYMFIPFISLIVVYLYSLKPYKLFSWFILVFEAIGLLGAFAIPFFSKSLTLTHNLLVAAYLLLISAICLYFYFKYSGYRLFQFVCFLLLVRIAFNFLVMPTRQVEKPSLELQANQMIEAGVEAITAGDKTISVYNPVVRDSVIIPMIKHPPYQLSYYYTKKSGKILPYHENEQMGVIYLTSVDNLDKNENIVIMDTLSMNRKDSDYVIYQLTEADK